MSSLLKGGLSMLEHYYKDAKTLARLRLGWTGAGLVRFAAWLTDRRSRRLPGRDAIRKAWHFCRFALGRGAHRWEDLPPFLPAYARYCRGTPVRNPGSGRLQEKCSALARARISQFLAVNVRGFSRPKPALPVPFLRSAPEFLAYLTEERGLSPETIGYYLRYLLDFESFLRRRGQVRVTRLSPVDVDLYVAERAKRWGASTIRAAVYALRTFVRYLHRERVLARDFSAALRAPMIYRLSCLPYSITWEEVGRLLASVNPRAYGARRDRAILLLLATYGLRAGELARLRLEDVDWRASRLVIRKRKGGNTTVYPLSAAVGNALLEYIRSDRPKTTERRIFNTVQAPIHPVTSGVVSQVVRHHLLRAKILAPHRGSHLLRHTCVQRLVDSGFSLKAAGDYVGHQSVASTEIYSKVNIEALRQVALDHGEEAL
jgi:integrase/recombinase XerD